MEKCQNSAISNHGTTILHKLAMTVLKNPLAESAMADI